MSIASFSVKQPVLVNLLSIFSLIMGGMVLKDMTRESIPAVPTGWCQVITLVPGASAEEVEQLVTVPLETAAGGVDNIDQMFSTSREGLVHLHPVRAHGGRRGPRGHRGQQPDRPRGAAGPGRGAHRPRVQGHGAHAGAGHPRRRARARAARGGARPGAGPRADRGHRRGG
ncbi:MAG: efflux RND transporter permease subunit [Sandaracinaceae bacterium]|nr:efflux RND transporter permease subunit [Sandaracinaceae bacterium]